MPETRVYGEEAFEREFKKLIAQQLDLTRDIVQNHLSDEPIMAELETSLLELLEDIDSQMRGGSAAKDLVLTVREIEKLSFLMGQQINLYEGDEDGLDEYLFRLYQQAGFSPSC